MTDQIGHNARGALRSYVQRVEALNAQKQEIAEDVKQVMTEAKAAGFDTKTIRAVVQLRKLDAATREERRAMLDLYMDAVLGEGASAETDAETGSEADEKPAAGNTEMPAFLKRDEKKSATDMLDD